MDYEFNFQLEIRAPYLLAGQRTECHSRSFGNFCHIKKKEKKKPNIESNGAFTQFTQLKRNQLIAGEQVIDLVIGGGGLKLNYSLV